MATDLFDLSGQVAVVTGASRGIGKAIALEMARAGARIVISSRNLPACEAVRDEIVAAGGDAIARACHIGRKADCEALVREALAHYGRIDILVANAAINPVYGSLAAVSEEAWDKIMTANVKSSWWLSNLVLPHMSERRSGSIILLSSIASFKASKVLGAYGISKAAEGQLARNLAFEWGTKGIRVNAIAPGLVQTDFARALWENPEVRAVTEQRAALGRIGQPRDIAGVAVFLASQAAGFITGQVIVVDGGSTLGE